MIGKKGLKGSVAGALLVLSCASSAGTLVNQILPSCQSVDIDSGALAYQFEPSSGEFRRSADNFFLSDGDWLIRQIRFKARFSRPPTGSNDFSAIFYRDDNKLPGVVACNDGAAAISQIGTDTYQLNLSGGEGCALEGGLGYWLELRVNGDAADDVRMEIEQVDTGDRVEWVAQDTGGCESWKSAQECGRQAIGPDLCFELEGDGPPVLLQPIPDQRAVLNAPWLFDAGAYFADPDGSPFSFVFSGLPNGLMGDPATGRISGTPSGFAVPVTVTVTVVAGDVASDSFQLTIRDKAVGQYTYQRLFPVITRPWHFNDVVGDLDVAVRGRQLLLGNPDFFRLDRMTLDGLPIRGQGIPSLATSALVKAHRVALAADGVSYLSTYLDDGNSLSNVIRRVGSSGSVESFLAVSGTPRDLAVTDRRCPGGGCLLVLTSTGLHRYDREGTLLGSFSNLLAGATRLAVNADGVLALASADEVRVFQEPAPPAFSAAPSLLTTITQDAGCTALIGAVKDVAVDPLGNVVLATGGRLTALRSEIASLDLCDDGTALPEPPGLVLPFAPLSVDINELGDLFVYSAERRLDRARLTGDLTTLGQLLFGARLSNRGGNASDLIDPLDAVVDAAANVYVIDERKQTLQRFTPSGVSSWTVDISQGANPGDHDFHVFLTRSGQIPLVGVLDTFAPVEDIRVFLFEAATGLPFSSFSLSDEDRSQFSPLSDVHGDPFGQIFIVGNNRFGRFDLDGLNTGIFQASTDPLCPIPITARSDLSETGILYVLSSSGLSSYDTDGTCLGDPVPYDLTPLTGSISSFSVAPDGSFAIAQSFSSGASAADPRIVKFSAVGNVIGQQGGLGFFPDQYSSPVALDFNGGDDLFVLDRNLRRVQRLNDTATLNSDVRAVLLAGGGPGGGNTLWDETQAITNFAYTVLRYLGLDRDAIQYLSDDTNLDIDGDGLANDVDATATAANLQTALTSWATGADIVNLYLADHGDDDTFRLNVSEILQASELDEMLDALQQGGGPAVRLIHEACRAGSFIDDLAGQASGQRIVLSSTASDQDANFANGGFLSFSNQFWTRSLAGQDLQDAFDGAASAITTAFADQTPVVDYDGDGVPAEGESAQLNNLRLAAPTSYSNPPPVLSGASIPGSVSGNSATVSVNATDADGVARVWAVVQPPGFDSGSANNPVVRMPEIELLPVSQGASSYAGTFQAIAGNGSYRIEIYAQDTKGVTSTSATGGTISVGGAFARRAVLLAGGAPGDSALAVNLLNTELAYATLLTQGYLSGDIQYLANGIGTGVDEAATLASVESSITSWAAAGTQDLLIYASAEFLAGGLRLNGSDTLTPALLDGYLDSIGSTLPGTLVVIVESDQSGQFLEASTGGSGATRYFLSSSSPIETSAQFNSGGFSFTQFLLSALANGDSLADAYATAASGISFSTSAQTPLLDDNGNAAGNDPTDGLASAAYFVGSGLAQAGNGPIVAGAPGDASFVGGSYLLTVDDVTSTTTIVSTFAVVSPPGGGAVQVFNLAPTGSDSYSGLLTGLNQAGDYAVAIYAADILGELSSQQTLTLRRTDGADAFEDDDVPVDASVLFIGDPQPQQHNFDGAVDEDWVRFQSGNAANYQFDLEHGGGGARFSLQIYSVGNGCEPVAIGCLDLEASSTGVAGADLSYLWPNTAANQPVYARITSDNGLTGFYDLSLSDPSLPQVGLMRGMVTDSTSGAPVAGAAVSTNGSVSTFSNGAGSFLFADSPGNYSASFSAAGYQTSAPLPYSLSEAATTWLNVTLDPEIVMPTVTDPGVTAVDTRSATLTASVDPMNEAATVSYRIFPSGGTAGSFLTADDSPLAAPASISQAVSGLDCGTAYDFEIRASNSAGTASAASSFSTADCVAPTLATGAASAVGKSTATLAGQATPNDFNLGNLRFAWGLTSGALDQQVAAVPSSVSSGSGATAVSANLSTLGCSTTVYFELRGVSSQAGSPTLTGGENSFSTVACDSASATTLSASSVTASSAVLGATVNPGDFEVSSLVFAYGTAPGALDQFASASPGSITAGSGATGVSTTLNELDCGTTWYFAVQGSSSEPAALDGGEQSFATDACQAPTVTTGAATGIGGSSAVLNGTVDPNGSGPASVSFDYGLTTAYGSQVAADQSPVSGESGQAVSAAVEGLACGTVYQFRVTATNGTGVSTGSNLQFTTAACNTPLIDSLTGTSAVTRTGATVAGSVDPNGSDTDTIRFRYGTSAALLDQTLAASPDSITSAAGVTAVSADLSGLSCGTRYFIQLTAQNADGAGAGAVEFFDSADCVSASLSLEAAGTPTSSSVTLNASVTPNDFDVSGLAFELGTTSGMLAQQSVATPASVAAGPGQTAISSQASGLDCGTQYFYRAVGTSSETGNESLASSESSVTTAACIVPQLSTEPAVVAGLSASLSAQALPGDFDLTDLQFAFGTVSGALSQSVLATPVMVSRADGDTLVTAVVENLQCATRYYFRAEAVSSQAGNPAVVGAELQFDSAQCDAPVVSTAVPPTAIDRSGATLGGSVLANSFDVSALRFDWGISAGSLDSSVTATPEAVSQGQPLTQVSAVLTGLACGTSYDYQLAGLSSQDGSTPVNGVVRSFQTEPCALPEIVQTSIDQRGQDRARLNAQVDPNGAETMVTFEYGLTAAYGSALALSAPLVGDDPQAVSALATGLECDTTYHYRVLASSASGMTSSSDAQFSTLSCAQLLLVDDDDNAPDVSSFWTAALNAAGVSFDVLDLSSGQAEPVLGELDGYHTVLWFTGNDSSAQVGPSADAEVVLGDFLDRGPACLAVSSQDYLSVRGATSLLQGWLGIAGGVNDSADTLVSGSSAQFSPLPATGQYALDFSGGVDNRTDGYLLNSQGESAFAGNLSTVAVQVRQSSYRSLLMGFPFSTLPGSAERSEVMAAILSYCQSVPLIFDSGFEAP